MDRLNPQRLFTGAGRPAVVGSAGEIVDSTPSTMDVARERVHDGVPDGYVVLAEHQTSGRGRHGGWVSCAHAGLELSVVMKAGFRASERMIVAVMGAVAATEALRHVGVDARIKWPNDIVVVRSASPSLGLCKLGGVIVEQVGRGDAAPAHILGIGLNINQRRDQLPSDLHPPAASVLTELGRAVDRHAVARALLQRLDAWYRQVTFARAEALLATWKKLSCLLNRTITCRHKDTVVTGRVLGLSVAGQLIVRTGDEQTLYLSDTNTSLDLPCE